ncbi:hypothetical protein Ciccas_013000 [Cichlidogyrus casuarinus]|uniref:Maf-like protein n=1 Tax=Cichlidogyrus casuarinus TaxID=1844966 RepID=A0ABD2PMH1_9PLAT
MLFFNPNQLEDIEFILGSGSPRRKELLALVLGSDSSFKTCIPDFDESSIRPVDVSIKDYVEKISKQKGLKIAEQILKDCIAPEKSKKYKIIISADTMMLIDDKILGKPKDKAEAKSCLKMYFMGSIFLFKFASAFEITVEIKEIDSSNW